MLEVVGEAGGRWRMLEEAGRNRDLKEASILSSKNLDFSHGGVNPPGFEDQTSSTSFKMLVISASLPNEFQCS